MEIYGMTGEHLGTIAHQSQSQSQPQPQPQADIEPHPESPLPRWKRTLLATPSVSARRGIARGFSAAYEDTSTLVLTSARSWFVDIRFALGSDPTGGASYWAFAGRSEVTFPFPGDDSQKGTVGKANRRGIKEVVEIPCLAHCIWRHEVDSKGVGEADEGDLYLLANGGVVEVGVSMSGGQGKVEMYKEYWTAVDEEGDADGNVACVVARTEERKGNGIGMVVRVGRHCQAILQTQSSGGVDGDGRGEGGGGGKVLVERWYRGEENGGWAKDWRSNTGDSKGADVMMPSRWVCEEGRKMGDAVELAGQEWEVVECA